MLLFAAYAILHSKYTGSDEAVIGTPTAGRAHPDLDGAVGMFVNTLAIRVKPEANLTFSQFVSDVKAELLQSLFATVSIRWLNWWKS